MLRSIFLVILVALSASVYADEFSYNSITASYSQIDFDNLNADGDALGINGSAEIGESFFVFGSYSTADVDIADVDTLSAGVGYHMPMSDQVDFVGSVSYEYIDVSVPGFGSADDNGFGLGIGLRYQANNEFEINGGIDYVDYSDGGDDTSFSLGFLYDFADNFSVGMEGDWSDDATAYGIGVRFYFGN